MMRNAAKVVLTGLALTTLGGCMGAQSTWMYPHAGTETLGQTSDEHRQHVSAVLEQDRGALKEDLDILFMTDRPTRLTRWHGQ